MNSIKLVMSEETKEKLRTKHHVEPDEVTQCFFNRKKGFLIDTREEHKTEPPTQKTIEIKTAYEPNVEEVMIYNKIAQQLRR